MAGYLNEDVQKWYKENKDLIGVIETLTKRCKELEKKADLANVDAMNWQHKFFVESARYDELIDTASKLDLENAELLQKNRDLSKHIYNLKNEVRKLNAACQVKSVKIESLKKKLANKDIRIANNVTKPYVPDNDYYRVENLWAVLGGMCK